MKHCENRARSISEDHRTDSILFGSLERYLLLYMVSTAESSWRRSCDVQASVSVWFRSPAVLRYWSNSLHNRRNRILLVSFLLVSEIKPFKDRCHYRGKLWYTLYPPCIMNRGSNIIILVPKQYSVSRLTDIRSIKLDVYFLLSDSCLDRIFCHASSTESWVKKGRT